MTNLLHPNDRREKEGSPLVRCRHKPHPRWGLISKHTCIWEYNLEWYTGSNQIEEALSARHVRIHVEIKNILVMRIWAHSEEDEDWRDTLPFAQPGASESVSRRHLPDTCSHDQNS
jgi:hypothetical protein